MPWTLTPTNAVIAASAVAATGLTAMVLPMAAQDRTYDSGGPRLSIAVVAPPERAVTPGPVMAVGQIVDGYEHRPYVQPVAYDPAPYTWDNGPLPMPEPRAWTSDPVSMTEARVTVTAPQPRGDPTKFGFDEPLPDFAAARRERQARIERIAAETATRAQAPLGAELDPEAAFY